MIKAAHLYLGLSLVVAPVPALLAQSAGEDLGIASNEAVYRQANRVKLREKLVAAATARDRQDLATAAKLYDDAWELVGSIGPGVEQEARMTQLGLGTVRLELARTAQRRGDYREADRQVKDVLRVDKTNQQALEFKAGNDKLLLEAKTHMPSPEVEGTIPALVEEKTRTTVLVQDGKLLYEMDKLTDAETKLKEALKLDPSNRAAYYYLDLIREKRYSRAAERRDVTTASALVDIEDSWATPLKRELLPVPNPYARSTAVYTSKGRTQIKHKLETIHLDTVKWDGLPLSEVIINLNDEAKKRDPERKGINFIINNNVDTGASAGLIAPGQATAIDPATGQPVVTGAPPEPTDINAIGIKINPPLTDITLEQALDAIVRVADKRIKYSLEDYAVVFSFKANDPSPLYSRRFKVNPNTFEQGLESIVGYAFASITPQGSGGGGGGGGGGGQGGQNQGSLTVPRALLTAGSIGGQGGGGQSGGLQGGTAGLRGVTRTNSQELVSAAVRQFFITLGVDLNPPKNVFWNDRDGTLLVRATLQDLDIIEDAVQALNIPPQQVNVKTKFVEITQNDSKALGFDWYLGNFLMNNKTIGMQAGTAPSYNGAPTTANPEGTFPGSFLNGTSQGSLPSDQLLTGGIRNQLGVLNPSGTPALATLSGILTDPQFRVVLRALEQRDGADLLSQGEVTTPSGRQAQITVVDVRTIVTGVQANQTAAGGGGGGGVVGGATGGGAVGSTINYSVDILPFGPTLDVVPYVDADGTTIELTIIPTITEFLGYDDPGGFNPQAQSIGSGNGAGSIPLTALLPLPHFRLRQVTTSALVWDGQTVVLGGLLSEDVTKIKDKVPVLGDLPLLGRFFRSESSVSHKKNLVIFVTSRILDPSGNPYHSDDEMPYNVNTIPSQRAAANAP
jgi:general secretion pathway protein D